MKKLFTNDKFFLAMVLCAVIGEAVYACINIFVYRYAIQAQFTLIFRVLCVIFLYSSYRKHSKNVMKGMMGALLAAQLITAIQYLSEFLIPAEYICLPLFAILSALIFINHFIINADHKASPSMVKLNQILVVLLFINDAVLEISWFAANPTSFCFVVSVANIIGFLGMSTSIVCVESRLDAYRLDREKAGWTEEKGYPEGYVHEYQKNIK